MEYENTNTDLNPNQDLNIQVLNTGPIKEKLTVLSKLTVKNLINDTINHEYDSKEQSTTLCTLKAESAINKKINSIISSK